MSRRPMVLVARFRHLRGYGVKAHGLTIVAEVVAGPRALFGRPVHLTLTRDEVRTLAVRCGITSENS